MATSKEREQFFSQMARFAPTVPLADVRKFLRYGATLQRLAEAQCNGDYPAAGPWGDEKRDFAQCKSCEASWSKFSLTKAGLCPDCRTSELARELAKGYGMTAHFQGDPRGCVFRLHVGECVDECKYGNEPRGHLVIYVP